MRTRDLEKLAPLDIVIDVGGVYDHSLRRYDHHQRGFDATFDDFHGFRDERDAAARVEEAARLGKREMKRVSKKERRKKPIKYSRLKKSSIQSFYAYLDALRVRPSRGGRFIRRDKLLRLDRC